MSKRIMNDRDLSHEFASQGLGMCESRNPANVVFKYANVSENGFQFDNISVRPVASIEATEAVA